MSATWNPCATKEASLKQDGTKVERKDVPKEEPKVERKVERKDVPKDMPKDMPKA